MNLMPASIAAVIPPHYSAENEDEPICYVRYFMHDGDWEWYGFEFDPATESLFGLVKGHVTEYGDFTLAELRATYGSRQVPVARDINFIPTPRSAILKELGAANRV